MEKQNVAGVMPARRTFLSIRQLTVAGFLSAITIFLGLTGYGFIPLVIMNATILHIPTIIGSLTAGRKVGMIVGFMFGIFSFIRSLQAPSALLLFAVQYNVVADAFICIVPRILIGVIAFELPSSENPRSMAHRRHGGLDDGLSHDSLPRFLYGHRRRPLCRSTGHPLHERHQHHAGHHGRQWHPGSHRIGPDHHADRHGLAPRRIESRVRSVWSFRLSCTCGCIPA